MTTIDSTVARNDFLNLLTTQLKNQDPLSPVNQEDFTGQLSQFSQLEQLEGLNSNFQQLLQVSQLNQGIGLVGRETEYFDPASGETRTGVVERLITSSGAADLLINNERVGLEYVSGVNA
jgi:flagellar basal-body rod modification protein FlgD